MGIGAPHPSADPPGPTGIEFKSLQPPYLISVVLGVMLFSPGETAGVLILL